MKTAQRTADMVVIGGVQGLDTVTVILYDIAPGAGGIIVECYGKAWSAFFNAMGDKTAKQFVASCDNDYLAGKLGRHEEMRRSREMSYLMRITSAIVEAIKS